MTKFDWTEASATVAALDGDTRARMRALRPMALARGQILFHPGDTAKGFVIVLSWRIEVFLIGPGGRDILLYAVEPGGSCVQTTLGLLGGEAYSGEAVTATDCRLVLVPRAEFLVLMDRSAAFRSFVFSAFALRMQGMMQVLERVAFQRVESRLARVLVDRAEGDRVLATHHELATLIGSAREVVSRRLDALARAGVVGTERGIVRLIDMAALRRLAAADDSPERAV